MAGDRGTERLLTIEAAAELTSFAPEVIVEWMARGLPYVPGKDGRLRPRLKDRRIKSTDLWAWVDKITVRKVEPVAGSVGAPAAGGLSAWRQAKGG